MRVNNAKFWNSYDGSWFKEGGGSVCFVLFRWPWLFIHSWTLFSNRVPNINHRRFTIWKGCSNLNESHLSFGVLLFTDRHGASGFYEMRSSCIILSVISHYSYIIYYYPFISILFTVHCFEEPNQTTLKVQCPDQFNRKVSARTRFQLNNTIYFARC